jgi:hypothetical protein
LIGKGAWLATLPLLVLGLTGCGDTTPPAPIRASVANRQVDFQRDGTYKVDWNVPGCSDDITADLVDKSAADYGAAVGSVMVPSISLGHGPSGSTERFLYGNGSAVTGDARMEAVVLKPESCDSLQWSITFTWEHDGNP